MSINIGDNNKISNSTIAEKVNTKGSEKKKTFFERHPVICSLLISFIAGFVLLFHFWQNIISLIEGWF